MALFRNFVPLTAKLAVLALFACVPVVNAQEGMAKGINLSAVVNANNQFAIDLYRDTIGSPGYLYLRVQR